MVSVLTYQSREDGVEYLPVIQKLFGSFKGDAFKLRVLPFFMHVMCDVLTKRHSGNGMVEYGWNLLVDVIVDKQLISIRIKSIAVEAFGRHLKRVDVSALFLFGCKIRPVKTYISIEKRRNCGCISDRM